MRERPHRDGSTRLTRYEAVWVYYGSMDLIFEREREIDRDDRSDNHLRTPTVHVGLTPTVSRLLRCWRRSACCTTHPAPPDHDMGATPTDAPTAAARLGSTSAPPAGSTVAPFDLSETVVCPTCAASMQAPCVAPAIRCAGCREVIYPSPPSSPELSVTLADNSPTDNAAGNESVRAQPTGQQLAIAIGRLARPAGAGLPPAEPG